MSISAIRYAFEPIGEIPASPVFPLVNEVEDVQVEILTHCDLSQLAAISATGKALNHLVVRNKVWISIANQIGCPIELGSNTPIYKQVLIFIEDLRRKVRNIKDRPKDISKMLQRPNLAQIVYLQRWLPPRIKKLSWQATVKMAKDDLRIDLVGPGLDYLTTSSQEIDIEGAIDRAYLDNQTELARLRLLNLDELGLTFLPVQTCSLNLTRLRLGDNQLDVLPPEICNMSNLSELCLEVNKLSSVPSSFNVLQNLRTLILRYNKFSVIPLELFELSNLEDLSLEGNLLTNLQPDIGKLRRLGFLNLSDNKLISIPRELGLLRGILMKLFIQNNQLPSIPQEILDMPLRHLDIGGNPLPLAFRVKHKIATDCFPPSKETLEFLAVAVVMLYWSVLLFT